MRLNFTLPAAGLLLLSAIACKKDSSGGKSSLDGNYAFTSMSMKSTSTAVFDDGGGGTETDVTVSDYTTTNNKGTVSISSGVMTSKGVSYSIATKLSYTYANNGVVYDEGTTNFNFDLPSFNSVANYKLVGADSILFTSGASSFGGMTEQATGGKFSISGNTLTMVSRIDTIFTDNSNGFPIQKHDVATQTTILTRQ